MKSQKCAPNTKSIPNRITNYIINFEKKQEKKLGVPYRAFYSTKDFFSQDTKKRFHSNR